MEKANSYWKSHRLATVLGGGLKEDEKSNRAATSE